MSGANFPRVHVWADNEDVTAAQLNAEFDNILNNDNPAGMGSYETNTTEMQKQTSPGGLGTESLATSLGGELERLRFVLARLTGTTYWYQAPALSIADISQILNTGVVVPPNRVSSGRVGPTSNQAMALVPDNTIARVITLTANVTPLVYFIAGTRYTTSANATLSGLTAAPSSQNTCLVNDASLTGTAATKTQGEVGTGTVIDVDNMGSGITSLVGKYAAFKITHAAVDEYFIAYVNSATQLKKAYRGYFFNSADAAISRVPVSDNDVITLMQLTYIFVKTDGTLDFTYNAPVVDFTAPGSPATGDFWFDFSTMIWKKYNGLSFVAANSTLAGVCIQDSTKTIAARTYEYFFPASALNTIQLELFSTTQIRGLELNELVYVSGSSIAFGTSLASWASTGQFASGVTLQANTTYYLYISDKGQQILDTVAPYDRTMDLFGFYHPSNPWRSVGYFTTDGSSNFTTPVNYAQVSTRFIGDNAVTTVKITDGAVTQAKRASLGQQISASSGNYTVSTSTFTAVTNLSVPILTTGRPVDLRLIPDGSVYPTTCSVGCHVNPAIVAFYRDGSSVLEGQIVPINGGYPPSSINGIDTPAAGSHTYTVRVRSISGDAVDILNVKLVAYEL